MSSNWISRVALGAVVCLAPGLALPAAAAKKAAKPATKQATATADSAQKKTMTLPADKEGTAFGSLTVEGEDRIRIEFERPTLELDLDPRQSPGLELGDARDILERERPDLVTPYLGVSALERSPYLGRPWLDGLTSGPVARFRPAVSGVERWRLAVVDSRGDQVAEWKGSGSPPREIEWNGLTSDGNPCLPGLTYSYVLEAFDRAGNKRNFVGEGFQLPAYRLESSKALAMLFAGDQLGGAANAPGAMVLEVASWINQVDRTEEPIRIKATARSFEAANAMSQSLVQQLTPLVLGDPVRLQAVAAVEPDAPPQGTVSITVAP